MSKRAAYEELLTVFNKHKDALNGDRSIDIKDRLTSRIALDKLTESFGISINPDCTPDWCVLSEHQSIGFYDGIKRSVSWSDDGSQPDHEHLYVIQFHTGAYIFGREYPTNTFQNFFDELKTFGPKYVDTANHGLYFTSESARAVHESFKGIFKKYADMVDDEIKQKRIEDMESELKKLKS